MSAPITAIIYQPDGSSEVRELDLPDLPDIYDLRELIGPMVGGYPDHVSVLHQGRRADMFVEECSAVSGQPRNEAATAIYRTAWLSTHPKDDPEGLPAIHGPAVLFTKRVWF